MSGPEFSRLVDRRHLKAAPLRVVASETERKALARRFSLIAIDRLEAELSLEADGEAVDAGGTLWAEIVQACAVTGNDLPVTIEEPLALRFVPEAPVTVEELELEEEQLDEIPYAGTSFDLGEAVAQSLALAIDPFATGPEADRVRKEKGLLDEAAAGPFAALAALKKD
uniref:YceD family protein n=1 Tax=Altererythrobacter segetis TaxID=1104773 RepID=UPI0014083356|nr:YceD family protein [Altererythrobacter segetis]